MTTDSVEDKREIRLTAGKRRDGTHYWIAMAANDGSVDYDGTGATPELALLELAQQLYIEGINP